jgi:ADP-ribosyl-[dinitrogen reductase] hydrolase
VEVGTTGARIGLVPCPGTGVFAGAGILARGLDADFDTIAAWGAAAVVTLIEAHETRRPTLAALRSAAAHRGMEWHHLPIRDGAAPDLAFETAWAAAAERLRALLCSGRSILVHCMGGCGRSGTIAARLLIELGETPHAAMERVRRARPGAIETGAQERYLLSCQPVPGSPCP